MGHFLVESQSSGEGCVLLGARHTAARAPAACKRGGAHARQAPRLVAPRASTSGCATSTHGKQPRPMRRSFHRKTGPVELY